MINIGDFGCIEIEEINTKRMLLHYSCQARSQKFW